MAETRSPSEVDHPAGSADRQEAVSSASAATTGNAALTETPNAGATEREAAPGVDLASATAAMSSALPQDALSRSIQTLKQRQADLRNTKKQITRELHNAERRKKRLRTRARQLTDEDLVQVLMMRKQARADRNASESGAAASSNGAASSQG